MSAWDSPELAPYRAAAIRARLTPRQLEVVELVANGATQVAISDMLGISRSAVRDAQREGLRKLRLELERPTKEAA